MFFNSDIYSEYYLDSPVAADLCRVASPQEHSVIFRWAKRAAREKTRIAWNRIISVLACLLTFLAAPLILEGCSGIAFTLLVISVAISAGIGFYIRNYNISLVRQIAGGQYYIADVFLKDKEKVREKSGEAFFLTVAVKYDPDKERRIKVMKNVYENARINSRLVLVIPTDPDYSYDIVSI